MRAPPPHAPSTGLRRSMLSRSSAAASATTSNGNGIATIREWWGCGRRASRARPANPSVRLIRPADDNDPSSNRYTSTRPNWSDRASAIGAVRASRASAMYPGVGGRASLYGGGRASLSGGRKRRLSLLRACLAQAVPMPWITGPASYDGTCSPDFREADFRAAASAATITADTRSEQPDGGRHLRRDD